MPVPTIAAGSKPGAENGDNAEEEPFVLFVLGLDLLSPEFWFQ